VTRAVRSGGTADRVDVLAEVTAASRIDALPGFDAVGPPGAAVDVAPVAAAERVVPGDIPDADGGADATGEDGAAAVPVPPRTPGTLAAGGPATVPATPEATRPLAGVAVGPPAAGSRRTTSGSDPTALPVDPGRAAWAETPGIAGVLTPDSAAEADGPGDVVDNGEDNPVRAARPEDDPVALATAGDATGPEAVVAE
jgi:hypothetical protein